MPPPLRVVALLLLGALAGCGTTGGKCGLLKVADLPLSTIAGRPVVAAEIAGKPTRLVVDTGTDGMALTADAIDRLGLSYDRRMRIELRGVGGGSGGFSAVVAGLRLGGVGLPDQRAGVLAHTGALRSGPTSGGVDGILGLPVLRRFDIDLDMPHRRMTLYRGRLCAGVPLPFPGRTTAVPVSVTAAQPLPAVPILLDGRRLRALLDTGAQHSLVETAVAAVPPDALARDGTITMLGSGPVPPRAHLHRFASFTIGNDHFLQPYILVIGDTGTDFPVILGMDYLNHRRVFISFSSDRIYIQDPASR